MENDKMKMVMMNQELFTKYAHAARTKLIDKMRETCEENGEKMSPMAELSEYLTATMFILEFKKLLFNSESDECED